MVRMRSFSLFIMGLFFLLPSMSLAKDFVVTYRSAENVEDKRYDYDTALLRLLLDKSKAEFGPYKLKQSPIMNYKRAILMAQKNKLKNFVLKLSVSKEWTDSMDYLEVPVDRGIVGYRVFFVSKETKKKLAAVNSLEDLKKFTIGQGSGWNDVDILRAQGFKVIEGPNYKGLFHMVANNSFDLFSRGANEVFEENKNFGVKIKNLVLDDQVALFYPLPRLFFTSKGNAEVLNRLKAGFKIASQDGSFDALFEKHYRQSIDFVKLKNRRLLKMENVQLKALPIDLKKLERYFYNPLPE